MAWRNRLAGGMKGRNNFRKMSEKDEDYDMPLLIQTTSEFSSLSIKSSSSSGRGSLGFIKGGFGNSGRIESCENRNLAAVPNEVETLSFRENSSSPLQTEGDNRFVAQFDPGEAAATDDHEDSATVFDDTSSDGSMYTTNKHEGEVNEDEENRSLKPPSLIDSDDYEDEMEIREASNKSTTNSSHDKTSKLSFKSQCGSSKAKLSSRSHRNYMEEDADAATWNADEIDAFVDAEDFGQSSGIQQPLMEISGVELLSERENAVNELQEINHLMTFNSLVLIQKQKNWIEGSIDATNGVNRGSSGLIMMELQNLERKIKLLMDNREWPNELERMKQKVSPLTPSKAFFKAMALIDKSIDQFHKGYLKYMSNTGEENHELKKRIAELIELNEKLKAGTSIPKETTETIRNLQKERDDLTERLNSNDEKLAALLPRESDHESPICSVESYIHKLEKECKRHLTEIESLKGAQNTTNQCSDSTMHDDESTVNMGNGEDSTTRLQSQDESISVATDNSNREAEESDHANVLIDDLSSNWQSLQEKEEAMDLATKKEEQVKKLTTTVADQQVSIDSLRSECKLMRMQLLELEKNKNDYKSQCDMKDSALQISQDRIANLEDEVLKAHAQCLTFEEDYEALKETFSVGKLPTNEETTVSQNDMKGSIEKLKAEFEEKLKTSEEEKNQVREESERLIRDMKAVVHEAETERDQLRMQLAERSARPLDAFTEEKKESEDDIVASPVTEKDQISFEQVQSRFAEKASKQALKIAELTEENEVKDEQLKALQDMVEMLLGNNEDKRQWGQRFSKLRENSQRRASELLNRNRYGGSMHGSRHGGSIHGSQHGSMHGDRLEEYANR